MDMRENWDRLKPKIRAQWGKVTDEELDAIDGDREALVGRVQNKYGLDRDEAERQVDAVTRGVAGDEPH